MSSSRFASLLYLVTFAFLLQAAFGLDLLFHNCSDTGYFSASSPYEQKLTKLITSYLPFEAPPSGFGLRTVGPQPNLVYGLALCRGDISTQVCKTCVVEAGNEIRKRCPSNKGAIIWYEECLLKYSNREFFGLIDGQNKFLLVNGYKASDPEAFNQKAKELLSRLTNEAYASPKLYSAGETNYGSQKIYGMAQCTRDLSDTDCKNCLDGLIGELPSCCSGQLGVRSVTGSCKVRYELAPFVNA